MNDIELLLSGTIHPAKLYKKSEDIIARTVAKNLGRPCSQETREKLSAALKGRKHSRETRAKLSASGRGRTASQETREKLSAALKGRNPLWSATKVRTPLGVFNSIKEATAAHGFGVNGITYRINKEVPGYEYI